MNLESLLGKLTEPVINAPVIAFEWEQSVASFPSALPHFLQIKNLQEWRVFCGLSGDADIPLAKTAEIISKSPELSMLAWHAYRRMYIIPNDNSTFREWPELRNFLNVNSGIFYLIIALAMVPLVMDCHQNISVSKNITKDTCRQIFNFTEIYRRDYPGE